MTPRLPRMREKSEEIGGKVRHSGIVYWKKSKLGKLLLHRNDTHVFMANFPPSDLLQWITRAHHARRIFQICRTTSPTIVVVFFSSDDLPPTKQLTPMYSATYISILGQWSSDLFGSSLSKIILFFDLRRKFIYLLESRHVWISLSLQNFESIPSTEVTIEVRPRPRRSG